MRILVTGACGFVGSSLLREWARRGSAHHFVGLDNLGRAGSESNLAPLRALGVTVVHGDIRLASDVDALPAVDWVIDAAALPSVLGGHDGRSSPRQLVEHNLLGTVNLLEYCRRHGAGFTLLSSSRVYSVAALGSIALESVGGAFAPVAGQSMVGLSAAGIGEEFSTTAPVSLYGASKLASEALALEYGAAFGFPVRINRSGVMAGAGQFGRADQGIISWWIHSWASGRPLSYLGYGGRGEQVRDCLHPRDLVPLLDAQFADPGRAGSSLLHASGGIASAVSLRQLSEWCGDRFGAREVGSVSESRALDVPWLVLDSARALAQWQWAPVTPREVIFEEIAAHALSHPHWLALADV